jgi:ribosomal protein L12E/L44/L45/RPP1/RPP2
MPPAIRALTAAVLVVAVFGVAVAKLPPAPPQTEEQKAAKKAKDDAAAETAKQQQARAEDRVVSRYIADQKAKGVTVTPQIGPTPAAAPAAAAAAAPAAKK